MKKINLKKLSVVSVCFLIVVFYSQCKKIKIVESTTTTQNIYGYLKSNPEKYSKIVKLIDKSGYSGFLDAYGSYTMFAPNDSAVGLYLTEINKPSVDAITEAEAQSIVKFHLLEDTLTTASFKDGKLPIVTMYGQFLVTSVANASGKSSFSINRQALIVNGNTRTGNGFVHELDHVLKPAVKSIAQLINDNAAYSIFKQALQATGWYDTINTINTTNPARRWFTVLAETNQALADSGFTSYNALKARYSNTGNPLNPLDSLNIYVAYHIIPEAKYLADIVSASSHYTLAPLEVLASTLDGVKVLINDLDFNGIHEPGIQLNRDNSDISATTGVLHQSMAHFAPKVRRPTAIYWDVADFPEVRKLPAIFRRANFNFAYGAVKDVTWDRTTNVLEYVYTTGATLPVFWNDYLRVQMGNTTRHNWIEFTTPIIIKGRYKVWVCYRAAKGSGTVGVPGGSTMPVQPSFDGVDLSRQFNFCEQRPNLSDGELEALGWKKYSPTATQNMTGKFLGIIDVATTDRHKIRLRSLPPAGTGNPENYLDMFHFIPINDNQYLPRFNRDGTLQNF